MGKKTKHTGCARQVAPALICEAHERARYLQALSQGAKLLRPAEHSSPAVAFLDEGTWMCFELLYAPQPPSPAQNNMKVQSGNKA